MTWETVPLGEVARFIRGVTYKPADVVEGPAGIACLRTKNIQQTLAIDDLVFVRSDVRFRPEQRVQMGDVLVSSANSWHLVGRAVQATPDSAGMLIGGFIGGLRFDTSRVDPRFGYRWFSSLATQRHVRSFGQQTTNIANLNVDRTMRMPLPLPPLPEQRRIAAILAEAEALRTYHATASALLADATEALFLSSFGHIQTLQRDVNVQALSALAGVIDCPHSTPEWTETGVTCLRTSNLGRGEWNWADHRFVSAETHVVRSRRSQLAEGDIVLSREGTIGVAAIVPPNMPMSMGQRLVQVRPHRPTIEPEYLLQYLLLATNPKIIGHLMVGSTSTHLNVRDLKDLRVYVPPVEKQRQYANQVKALRSALVSMQRRAGHLDALFTSLQHRAFRGEF